MMKYLKKEFKILQELKNNDKLKLEEQELLTQLLQDYNTIFHIAYKQQEYINRKRPEYAKAMDENFKLTEKNNFLTEENKRYKNALNTQNKYYKELEKEVRRYRKIIQDYEDQK